MVYLLRFPSRSSLINSFLQLFGLFFGLYSSQNLNLSLKCSAFFWIGYFWQEQITYELDINVLRKPSHN